MKEAIKHGNWILLHKNGEPVLVGAKVTSFRGSHCTVSGGKPPHKLGSTGRVYTSDGEYFPSVFNLVWQKTATQGESK
jgi:hypothetical protein